MVGEYESKYEGSGGRHGLQKGTEQGDHPYEIIEIHTEAIIQTEVMVVETQQLGHYSGRDNNSPFMEGGGPPSYILGNGKGKSCGNGPHHHMALMMIWGKSTSF